MTKSKEELIAELREAVLLNRKLGEKLEDLANDLEIEEGLGSLDPLSELESVTRE